MARPAALLLLFLPLLLGAGCMIPRFDEKLRRPKPPPEAKIERAVPTPAPSQAVPDGYVPPDFPAPGYEKGDEPSPEPGLEPSAERELLPGFAPGVVIYRGFYWPYGAIHPRPYGWHYPHPCGCCPKQP